MENTTLLRIILINHMSHNKKLVYMNFNKDTLFTPFVPQATVLEEMPPFPERESSLLAKLKKKKPAVGGTAEERRRVALNSTI